MGRNSYRYYADWLPLIILFIYSIELIITVVSTNIVFSYEHYFGLIMLFITFICFLKSHKIGVLVLGSTLVLGLFKVLAYTAGIKYTTLVLSINGNFAPKLIFQPIFFLWLALHFILSGRHYIGILSKIYWINIYTNLSKDTN